MELQHAEIDSISILLCIYVANVALNQKHHAIYMMVA